MNVAKGLKKCFYDIIAPLDRRLAIKKIRKLEDRLPSHPGRFCVPFIFKGHGHMKSISPVQTQEEIHGLYQEVIALKPRRVLEIGTDRGGTFYLWAQAAAPDATLVSVDLPGGNFGGGYPKCRTGFYRAFGQPDQQVHLLLADSHVSDTKQQVVDIFRGEPIDYLFIDGDHTYNGVRSDFVDYGPLVRGGGVIGFHDICVSPNPDTQVDRLWKQLRTRYTVEEFIWPNRAYGGHKIGVGLLRVPESGLGDWVPDA